MFTHLILVSSSLFGALELGLKEYTKKNDDDYRVGDVIYFVLQTENGRFPGKRICEKITDITTIGDTVIMSIERCDAVLPCRERKN